jgi:hypothetical protein
MIGASRHLRHVVEEVTWVTAKAKKPRFRRTCNRRRIAKFFAKIVTHVTLLAM